MSQEFTNYWAVPYRNFTQTPAYGLRRSSRLAALKRRNSIRTFKYGRKRLFKPYKSSKNAKKLKTLNKKVSKISAHLKNDRAVHTHRNRDVFRIVGDTNEATCVDANGITVAKIETAMAGIRTFDAGTNALVTTDLSSGTFHRDIMMSVNHKLTIRNNYKTPVEVRVYDCTPKQDTSTSPLNYYIAGMLDQGNPSTASPLVYPTDAAALTDIWDLKCTKKLLMPCQELKVSRFLKDKPVDPSLYDAHNLGYQKAFNCHQYLIRITGVIGHDTSADEQGMIKPGVDCVEDVVYTFKYDGGAQLNDVTITDNSDTFTNGGGTLVNYTPDLLSFALN